MSRPDGGPAFPKPIGNNGASHYEDREVSSEEVGMTLRDYFAAHAPKSRASWFEPTMLPKPEPIYDHEHPSEQCFECSEVNWQERLDWKIERARQYELQWPYAYADAMLAERAK